ncbi:dynein light chain type 1-domain-containing protein [Syncephalis plumigaleata]|nr:dynein light chain type 1-domain-containing protein [Syncephalis plumigaleata]
MSTTANNSSNGNNNNGADANSNNIVLKNVDMSDDMQKVAIKITQQAMEQYTVEKDIAAHIKREFDKKYGTTWHCVVGRNFGSYVTHETKHFIYFYQGAIAVLLFKSG